MRASMLSASHTCFEIPRRLAGLLAMSLDLNDLYIRENFVQDIVAGLPLPTV